MVGNQGEQFTVGANLMLVLLAVQEEEWDELDRMIRQFQNACMGLKYAEIPVVVAPFGLDPRRRHARSRCTARASAAPRRPTWGWSRSGVGLVPAGGGTKEMALRAHDRCAGSRARIPSRS